MFYLIEILNSSTKGAEIHVDLDAYQNVQKFSTIQTRDRVDIIYRCETEIQMYNIILNEIDFSQCDSAFIDTFRENLIDSMKQLKGSQIKHISIGNDNTYSELYIIYSF